MPAERRRIALVGPLVAWVDGQVVEGGCTSVGDLIRVGLGMSRTQDEGRAAAG